MKVDITHTEAKKGFFGKHRGYNVGIGIELSEEEKSIIKNKNLGDFVAFTIPESDPRFGPHKVTLKRMTIQSWGAHFSDTVSAQHFAEEVKDAMKTVKKFIEESKEAPASESFEL